MHEPDCCCGKCPDTNAEIARLWEANAKLTRERDAAIAAIGPTERECAELKRRLARLANVAKPVLYLPPHWLGHIDWNDDDEGWYTEHAWVAELRAAIDAAKENANAE